MKTWNGRAIAHRVWVVTGLGKFLYRTTAERVHELLVGQSVEALPDGDKIWRVLLLSTPGPVAGAPRDLTPRDYASAALVYRAKVGDPSAWAGHWAYELKHLPRSDRWAYRQALTDMASDRVMKPTHRSPTVSV